MLADEHKHTARYFDRGQRIGLEIAKETLMKNYDDSIRVIDKLRYARTDYDRRTFRKDFISRSQ